MSNSLETLQIIQLNAYNAGKIYQAGKVPINNTVQSRIKLPICNKDEHDIDALWCSCKKCGMIMEEIWKND